MPSKNRSLPSTTLEDFLHRLPRHPQLQAKFESLLRVVENAAGDATKADEAEQRVFEVLRLLGQQAIQAWAERKQQHIETTCDARSDLARKQKKLHGQTRFGRIQIQEQTYRSRRTRKLLRPFAAAAEVVCRGYSLGLQRVLTDFGADHSFAQVVAKVKEHYLIEVPVSAARQHTQRHAAQMKESEPTTPNLPAGGVAQVIAETDGCMIPIVKINAKGPKDRRKRRLLDWQEARLRLVYRAGSLTKHYQATLRAVEVAGAQLLEGARQVGGGRKSRIHCVGDGAGWIVRQVEERFGEHGSYRLDFYHVSEYLAKAGEAISSAPQAWRKKQQECLKGNRVGKVLEELGGHLEEEGDHDEPGPVRACWRYQSNRLEPVMNFRIW